MSIKNLWVGGVLVLKGKSGVGIIVDYSRDYTIVNGE